MRVQIVDIDHMGRGIAKENNKVIFIPKTIPGDIVDIDIVNSKKNYDIGMVKDIVNRSKDRIDAKCPYYDICGGCNISNFIYDKQLLYKKNKVINIFKRFLNIDINPEIIPSKKEYAYRNKITLHNDNKLGLVSLENNIIDIDKCSLVSEKVNDLINLVKKEDISDVKEITIREFNNGLVLDIYGKMNIDNVKDDVISIYMNNKLVYEKERGYFVLNNIKYFVSNDAFFQINISNIENLYNQIIRLGNFNKNDKVIDLYCGVGSITLYISSYVKNVLGIEIVDSAIDSAKENAKINNIKNVSFICGSVSSLIDDNKEANKIIVDPPRSGLDKHTVKVLNTSKVERIIYVSCDPITLARDINLLNNYKLKDIILVDMFPQTYHVETVCILERK